MRPTSTIFSRAKFFCGNEIRRLKLRNKIKSTPDVNFIWVPKNAGTSIFHSLQENVGMVRLKRPWEITTFPNSGSVTFGHYQYASLLHSGIISSEYHSKSWKFCVTRCPYERALSLHKYLTKGKDAPKLSLNEFLHYLWTNRQHPGFFHVFGFSQAAPQSSWIYLPNGKPCFNKSYDISHLDVLENDLSELHNLSVQFPRLNKAQHESKVSALTTKQIALINDIYREDFERLNYTMF